MNIDDLMKGIAPPAKVSRPEPNVANQIREHLLGRIPEAFEVDGVWITGSNVWRFLYGELPDVLSDIDVIVEPITTSVGDRTDSARRLFLDQLGATYIRDCSPSVPADINAEGAKYESKGRTIDVWETTDNIPGSLSRYPDHSHAHCRAAYNCKTGVLIVLPNTKAQ